MGQMAQRGVPADIRAVFIRAWHSRDNIWSPAYQSRIMTRSEDGEFIFPDCFIMIKDAEIGALVQVPDSNTVVLR
jgi:hypothetical protein